MTSNRMNVETSDRELRFTREFDAPRRLVFDAFSSCEHLRNWWGPRSWPMAECTMEFRVGGVWHYCLRGPNEGDEAWSRAVFEEIVEPEKLAYRDGFSDAQGGINQELPQVTNTYWFTEENGKTTLTGHSRYETAADLQTVLDMGVVEGMTETLDRLDEHLIQVRPT